MENTSELACTYAALILADDDVDVTGDKIQALIKAAGVNNVEPYWPSLFAKSLSGVNVKELLSNVGSSAGAPAAAAAAPAAAGAAAPAAAKKEEKKEESESGSDDDMGLGLFD